MNGGYAMSSVPLVAISAIFLVAMRVLRDGLKKRAQAFLR